MKAFMSPKHTCCLNGSMTPDGACEACFGRNMLCERTELETSKTMASAEADGGLYVCMSNRRDLLSEVYVGDALEALRDGIRQAMPALDELRALTPVSAYMIDGHFSGMALRNAAVLANQEMDLPFHLQQR